MYDRYLLLGCAALRHVELNGSLPYRFGDGTSPTMKALFPDDYTQLKNVMLGPATTNLPAGFFKGCASLRSIQILGDIPAAAAAIDAPGVHVLCGTASFTTSLWRKR